MKQATNTQNNRENLNRVNNSNAKAAPTYCPDYDPTVPQGARAVAAAASPDRVTLRTFTDRQRAPQLATSFHHRQEAAEWLSRAARGVGSLAPEAVDVLKVAPDCLIYYSKRNGEYVCDFVADDEGRPLCGRVEDFRALLLLYRKRHQLKRIAADITTATTKGQRLVTATEDDRARVIVEHDPENDLYLSSWYVGQERDETRATLTARQAAEMVWTFREGYAADLGDIVTRCESVSE